MTSSLVTIDEFSSLNKAAMEMLVKRIGSLLILNKDNTIKGLITERDLLIALHHILLSERLNENLS
ncbi:MAG: CBS domain-containing protein, partial [Saccharolobus sp.]